MQRCQDGVEPIDLHPAHLCALIQLAYWCFIALCTMASSCDCLHMKCVMSRCVLPPYCVNWLSPLAFGSTHMPLGWFFFSNVFFPMWNHKDEWCVCVCVCVVCEVHLKWLGCSTLPKECQVTLGHCHSASHFHGLASEPQVPWSAGGWYWKELPYIYIYVCVKWGTCEFLNSK